MYACLVRTFKRCFATFELSAFCCKRCSRPVVGFLFVMFQYITMLKQLEEDQSLFTLKLENVNEALKSNYKELHDVKVRIEMSFPLTGLSDAIAV